MILEMIARGEALTTTVDRVCLEIETRRPSVICTVMTADAGGLLHPLSAPSLPPEFHALFDGILMGPNAGNCGSAAYLGEPVAVIDIERDPKWEQYRHLVLPLGVRAGWSIPIPDDAGTTIAVLGLYFREMRTPSHEELELATVGVRLCSIALQRYERMAARERRATVDALTGQPNRASFNAALSKVPVTRPGAWALLMIDLDNLKVVNDTFGHQAGDALIQIVAQRVADAMAPDTTFRFGGDEFAVILQHADALRDLDLTAERIFAALGLPADCDGHIIVPKATIGGAVFNPHDGGPDTVKQNADYALYHAKETGRGGFVRYWPGIGTRITHRRDAVREVAAALDDGRIDAHYQPVVRLGCGKIVGVEALCRMTTPDGDILPAAAFLEATSDAHIASALTKRMISIVAKDMREWLDNNLPVQHVGVNVSAADFYTGSLTTQLIETFGTHGVPLDRLIVEVSEEVYLGRRDRVVEREVKALRESGVRVALDNFGTGYASLTQLLTVPVDIIKIDRSFTARLCPEDPSVAIVEGLLAIAGKLGIRVVAEGLETEDQARRIQAMGCQLGQGFAFSLARDRKAVSALLRNHAQGLESAVALVANGAPRTIRRDVAPPAELQPTGTG